MFAGRTLLFFCLRIKVSNAKNAVVLLGLNAAVTPSFRFRLYGALPRTLLFQDFDTIQFWKHSLAVAVIGAPKPILTPSPELLI